MLYDHNRGQGHVRSPGKKGQAKKFRDLELRYMFLGQIFAKNAKKWHFLKHLKHFLKHQNRSKNKIRKITVKSRNDVKSACFWHVLCHISAIFEDIDLKFCTHIYQLLPSNILSGFLKILILRGKILEKKKNCRKFWKFWGICKIVNIRDSSFVAPLILRHFM